MANKHGKNWVDFKEIKEKITLEMIFNHYNLFDSFNVSGSQLYGRCPIHKGTNPRQFSADLTKNIFNCFGDCGGGGNIFDFVAKMEGDITIRQAALLIKEWFNIETPKPKNVPVNTGKKDKLAKHEMTRKEETPGDSTPTNQPLTFRLKHLDTNHPFFKERGIEPATVDFFGLGYCSKGMMVGRIAIPIHNHAGELVAYCGRGITSDQIAAEKYKQPPNFSKSEIVFNLHRQTSDNKTLVLVESFLSVFKLHQAGFNQAVALMGSSLSEAQEKAIIDFLGINGRVILLFDADEAGQRCTQDCLTRLSSHLFVKCLDIEALAKVAKPHKASEEDLKKIFSEYCIF